MNDHSNGVARLVVAPIKPHMLDAKSHANNLTKLQNPQPDQQPNDDDDNNNNNNSISCSRSMGINCSKRNVTTRCGNALGLDATLT